MKKILITLAVLTLSAVLHEAKAQDKAYLFSYFADQDGGLLMAYSYDGLDWKDLSCGKPIMKPYLGPDKLLRDPSICKGPDGLFHMAWTTGWWDRIIGHASSPDLIHWSEQQTIGVMMHEPEAKNSWAPEITYDKKSGEYFIYWATTIPGRHKEVATSEEEKGLNHRIYYVTTRDFRKFSKTRMYFNPDFCVIDAAIVKDNKSGDFIMVLKNENSNPPEKNIRITRSKSLKKGFPTKVSAPITGNYWAEGPSPIFIGNTLYVYFDKYKNGEYGAVRSLDNGKNWEDISDKVHFPAGMRHGTAFEVDATVLENLLKHFSATPCAREAHPNVSVEDFGSLADGTPTKTFTIVGSNGASLQLCDYGARILKICIPDRDGVMADIVSGYGNIDSLQFGRERFCGPVIGRYANRIENAAFSIDGIRYELDANELKAGVPVQCHGGTLGFDRKMWDAEILENGVRFHYLSPDGDQGFPGNCDCFVTYTWSDDNVLRVEYDATTDKPTHIALSNHTYMNLRGNEDGNILAHELRVEADSACTMNRSEVPDGVVPVEGTPWDFRETRSIESSRNPRGASACWLIRDWDGSFRKVADLHEPEHGRGVEVWSVEPCLLTWSSRGHKGNFVGKYNRWYANYAMLLETIHVPDTPNQPQYPSTLLLPGEKYHSETEFRFYAR